MSEDLLTPEQKATLPIQDGCKPLFVVFKVRARCALGKPPSPVVVPFNDCWLWRTCAFVQHKVVIGKIFGANAPELENVVSDNIFPKKEEE